MCGRFTLTSTDDLVDDLELAMAPPALTPRFNVAPTQRVAVVTNRVERELELFRWGLVPRWAKDLKIGARMINARSETVAEKPAFRSAYKHRRCLVLGDGFYEWKREGKARLAHYIHRADKRGFAMAGLWEQWRDADGEAIHSCTILTTAANDLIATIHHRMPVMISPEDYGRWLHPEPLPPDMLQDLLVSAPAETFHMYPVTSRVGRVSNDDARCLEPAPVQAQLF